jgi:hypothetical protein
MADKTKDVSPLEALEQRHAAESKARAEKLATLHKELRAAEQLVRETKAAIGAVQQDNIRASFAFDSARAALLATKKKAAA